MSPARQPAGTPTGGQFAATGRAETGVTLDAHEARARRREARQARVDQVAATTRDEATQLRIAESGESAQREMLQQNPHLTTRTLEWMVDHWTFNPRHIPALAAQANMTDELRARIRPFGSPPRTT